MEAHLAVTSPPSATVLCLLLALVIPPTRTPGAVADLVIRHGQLIAMVAADPEVVPLKGIVVNGGRIESIIRADDAAPLPSRATSWRRTGDSFFPG